MASLREGDHHQGELLPQRLADGRLHPAWEVLLHPRYGRHHIIQELEDLRIGSLLHQGHDLGDEACYNSVAGGGFNLAQQFFPVVHRLSLFGSIALQGQHLTSADSTLT